MDSTMARKLRTLLRTKFWTSKYGLEVNGLALTARDLKSVGLGREGSSPSVRTIVAPMPADGAWPHPHVMRMFRSFSQFLGETPYSI